MYFFPWEISTSLNPFVEPIMMPSWLWGLQVRIRIQEPLFGYGSGDFFWFLIFFLMFNPM